MRVEAESVGERQHRREDQSSENYHHDIYDHHGHHDHHDHHDNHDHRHIQYDILLIIIDHDHH